MLSLKAVAEIVQKYLLGVVMVAAMAWFTAFRDEIREFSNLPDAVAANGEAIRRLSMPNRFFEMSERSGPLLGHCVEGENCRMRLRIRRFQDALDCLLAPDTLTYFYRDPRTNEVYDVTRIEGAARNIGTEWRNREFVFTTPTGVSPNAEFCANAKYTDCPNQIESDGQIGQPAECISVTVLK